MPHNSHTRAVREYQYAQKVRQEKELATLMLKLHDEWVKPTAVPFIDATKEHRRVRRMNNQRHKSNRARHQ